MAWAYFYFCLKILIKRFVGLLSRRRAYFPHPGVLLLIGYRTSLSYHKASHDTAQLYTLHHDTSQHSTRKRNTHPTTQQDTTQNSITQHNTMNHNTNRIHRNTARNTAHATNEQHKTQHDKTYKSAFAYINVPLHRRLHRQQWSEPKPHRGRSRNACQRALIGAQTV